MAIWQLVLKIFPEQILIRNFSSTPLILDLESIESIDNWDGFKISEKFFKNLNDILPEQKSWSLEIRQFGNLDKSCVEFGYENQDLFSITVKLDVRDVPLQLIDFLFKNLPRVKLSMYALDGAKVTNKKNLLKKITNSSASQFLKDPEKFLKELK